MADPEFQQQAKDTIEKVTVDGALPNFLTFEYYAKRGKAQLREAKAAFNVPASNRGATRQSARSSGASMETLADLKGLAEKAFPIGYFDPLKLSEAEFWGQSNEATIGWLRHAEIKHGRVAMAGFVGYLVHANGIHFPWKIPGDELCGTVSAPELWDGIPAAAKWQIISFVGFLEWWSELRLIPGETHYMRGGKPGYIPPFTSTEAKAGIPHPVPFNFYDPFKFNEKKSDEWKAKKLVTEINNGRLAMLGLMS